MLGNSIADLVVIDYIVEKSNEGEIIIEKGARLLSDIIFLSK